MPASEQLSLHELSINTSPARDPKASARTKPALNSRKRQATPRQQTTLLPVPPATAKPIATPSDAATATPIDRPTLPAPLPLKELPQGWIDPADPNFNSLKNCRLCGAPISTGGLDHSLCSGDCGWVVDPQWLVQQQRLKRGCASVARSKHSEPQAATHSGSGESETLDLLTYGFDRDTSVADGGVA